MDCLERLKTYLHDHDVPFEVQRHTPVYTAHEVAATEHIPMSRMAKVVMVVADSELVMLVVPASCRIDELRAAEALDAHQVRLAREEDFSATFLDCDVGAMPPFGNLYGVPVYVDRMLSEEDTIVFQAGTHTETIGMAFADFVRLVQPTIAGLAAPRILHHV